MNTSAPSHVWSSILERVRTLREGTRMSIDKWTVPHPIDAGAQVSVGLPVGQLADYRFAPGHDCSGLHVQEFETYWSIHVDIVHPACDLFSHLREEAPGGWVAGGAAVGALVGLALGRSSSGILVGAALGALIAVATLPQTGEGSTVVELT